MDVVTGAMGNLGPKLLQLLGDEYKLQKGLKEQVRSLSVEVESSHAFLRKVGDVPPDQLDEQVRIWAREVRDASYDMEDILDTFLIRVDGCETADMSRLKRALKRLGGLFIKAKARHDIAGAIEEIKVKLQEVADRRARYKIDEVVARPAAATSVDPRLSALYTKASQLVGIDEPRNNIIEMMSIGKDDASSKEMKIISIVGSGGMGKTTLAKTIYDKVNRQFDCGAFVPVGLNPEPTKVLRDILIELIDDTKATKTIIPNEKWYNCDDLMGLDKRQLINKLRTFLEGKRYFIVIDDLWDTPTWRIIKNAFVESNYGSRIVVTSRNAQISAEIGDVYIMKELSDSNSRRLLYTRTFGGEDNWPADNKNEVAEVSKKILSKCHGVPLAIITIASLLASKQIEEWSHVYNSVGFGHGGDSAQVKDTMKILSFSYYDLPSHLRTCMLYLSAFPEDYLVKEETLIWRWIAEDLVHKKNGKSLFEVAGSYFYELVNRGMVLPVEDNNYIIGCRVHDMVLHMIRDISRHENFLAVQDSEQWPQGNIIRRLALHPDGHIQVDDMGMPKVRSFNAISFRGNMAHPVLSGFQFLRVLALEDCRALEDHHLKHIGKLLHLRYLGLNNTPIFELPKEVGDLKFLQTLMLDGTGIDQLPTSLGKLTKLMCLHGYKKTIVPDWIGKLTSLVELSGMHVAAEDKWFVKELGKLRDLRVLDTEIDIEDDGLAREFMLSLSNLQKIEYISVLPLKDFPIKATVVMEPSPVLHCNNLRALRLVSVVLSRLPAWINPQNLPNLSILGLLLSDLDQQDVEILGRFQNLCDLKLAAVEKVSPIISIYGGGGFRNLKCFQVMGLHRLKFEHEAMPRLEVLMLDLPLLDILKVDNLDLDIGLGNLSSLQSLDVFIDSSFCFSAEVEKVEAELRHAISIHPNRPTIEIRSCTGFSLVEAELDERRKQRGRLWEQVFGQMALHQAMCREALDYSFSDAKDKVQPFIGQFHATISHVNHELLQLREDIYIHDHDLNRVAEHIAAIEGAYKILTDEYPRLAAMLEGLRLPFSLQEASPGLDVIILNIHALNVKLDSPGVDFGLGKLSSLQKVKAHIECSLCFPKEVEEVEINLRQTVDIHPNSPTLEITRFGEDQMLISSDSQMLEKRQKWRARRLRHRIDEQKKRHNALRHEASGQIDWLRTNMNVRDAIDKMVRLREEFGTTADRVMRELLPLEQDKKPLYDRDLNRMTQDIAAMERALEIYTHENPRLATMKDELIAAVSRLQVRDSDRATSSFSCFRGG